MTNSSTPVLVEKLNKSYGDIHALVDFSLRVEPGEIVGILGPNGAGKTTLVEVLEGIRFRDAGQVEIFGRDPAHSTPSLRDRVGIVLQQFVLPGQLTPNELLNLYRAFYRRPAEIDPLLKAIGLEKRKHRLIETLSGGQKQRLAVGLALVGNPNLIILDEPTSQLDAQARVAVWNLVRASAKERGCAVIVTTHQIEEMSMVCDHIVIVDHGQSIACGTPSQLIRDYAPGVRCRVWMNEIGQADLPRLDGIDSVALNRDAETSSVTFFAGNMANAIQFTHLLTAAFGEDGIVDIELRANTLEAVFLKLTGNEIRDGK